MRITDTKVGSCGERGESQLLLKDCFVELLTARFGRRSWLISLNMGAESMLICYIANLSKHSVLVLVSVAAFHFMRMMTLLLLPLFVTFVVDNFVSILVGVEFVVFVVFVML